MNRFAGYCLIAVVSCLATAVSHGDTVKDNWSKILGEGPANIKLLGVVPFGGDFLYDAKGNKLGENPYFFDFDSLIKGNKVDLLATLIFEINGSDDLMAPYFEVSGHRYGGRRDRRAHKQGDKYIYPQQMYLGSFDESIDSVDSVLRYYGEKFNGAEVVFEGPFAVGDVKKQQLNGLDFVLEFNGRKESGVLKGASFTITYDKYPKSSSDAEVLVYDKNGNRHIASGPIRERVEDAIRWEYFASNLPGRLITHITVGEDRYEKVFKGVVVRHPEAQADLQKMLDEMAKRLGLEGRSKSAIYNYRYKNPGEALKVIEVVRGTEAIREVSSALARLFAKSKLEDLEPGVQAKLLDAANRWSKSKILYTKKTGIQLGLRCGQMKYAEQMLDILEMDAEGRDHAETRMLQWGNVISFYSCISKFKPEHIDRLKKLVLTSDNYKVVRSCLWALRYTKNDAMAQARRELAADSRPWIWWPAVGEPRRADFDELSDDLKLKFAAKLLAMELRGAILRPELAAEVARLKSQILKLYGAILTPEISYKANFMGPHVTDAINIHMPPDEATLVFVRYMRQLSEPEHIQLMSGDYHAMQNVLIQTKTMIRKINEWHNINIGGLGVRSDEGQKMLSSVANLLKLADETIEWYEGRDN